MTSKDVEIGKTYTVKVSGKLQPVRITGESKYGGWDGINENSKRQIRIRSARKLRREWTPTRCRMCVNCELVAKKRTLFADDLRSLDPNSFGFQPKSLEIRKAFREFAERHPCTHPSDYELLASAIMRKSPPEKPAGFKEYQVAFTYRVPAESKNSYEDVRLLVADALKALLLAEDYKTYGLFVKLAAVGHAGL